MTLECKKELPIYSYKGITNKPKGGIFPIKKFVTLAVIVILLFGSALLRLFSYDYKINPKIIKGLNNVGSFTNQHSNEEYICPIVKKIDPEDFMYDKGGIERIMKDKDFREQSIEKLISAVNCPTQVFDDMKIPDGLENFEDVVKFDKRWEPFGQFHDYLEKAFPLVHSKLKVEKVNHLGLVYTWQGSTEKKPILLTAHMDVVPIQKETLDQWKYPPFNATLDGDYIFGRGVSDCKNLLVGLMETIELLLTEDKFQPERTIILAFGYDEESIGDGARHIYEHLESRYGKDSFYAIIDEGEAGYVESEGVNLILPATTEKGYLDSVIDIYTPGGHSSIPPPHTSIGILARLIERIEDDVFSNSLTFANPVLNRLQCTAVHSSIIDKELKSNILKAHLDVNANQKVREYLESSIYTKFLIETSQAVDIVSGGVKSNALPEHSSVLVNHRINIEDSVKVVTDKILRNIWEIAKRFDLGVKFDGEFIKEATKHGYIDYSLVGALEPAPASPADGKVWKTFGGSLRYLYEDIVFPEKNQTYIVSPFISTGNTDTKSYWNLTRNIYRYLPALESSIPSNVHSINENGLIDSHILVVGFYYYYLQVVDKVTDDIVV